MRSYCAARHARFGGQHTYVGVADYYLQLDATGLRNCSFGQMAASHIGVFRIFISWGFVERTPRHYDFSLYDRLIADLAQHHMTALAVIVGAPLRLTTAPQIGPYAGQYPPAHAAQFASFAAQAAKRYGRGGTFWRGHPAVPYYPVTAWQVWNEPNLKIFWEPSPNAPAYARLLRATYKAVKKVDRRATIVMAGMPYATQYSPASSFYTQLYKLGARGTFDVLALHDYAPNPEEALLRLQLVRGIMDGFHDRRTPIWITEMGWATTGPPPPYSPPYIAGVAGQRNYISRFFRYVAQYRSRLRLGEVVWYGWRDIRWQDVHTPDFWGYHTGLFTNSLRPKPGLAAFTAAIRQLNR